jgi:UDP-glucose 4-epimerase
MRMSGAVLVTGGAGFIGSHIAEAYLAAGWSVTCLDDLSRGKREQVPEGAKFVQADVRSAETHSTIADGKFDVVVHQAAQIDVRISVEDPALDASINLVGFANILSGVAAGRVKRVVFASSGGVVYGDPPILPTPEPTANLPISPYGVSKLAGEHYLRVLGALHGFEGVAMRYANVYGPRQDPKSEAGVVSIFVSRMLEDKPVTIFGDGTQTRDYVFVRDVARANLLAGTVSVSRGDRLDVPAFNIGTGRETSVNDLAQHVGRAIGRTPRVEYAPPRPGELFRSCLDVSKAARELQWTPQVTFDEGMKALAAWFEGSQR